MTGSHPLGDLAALFATLSLMAIGGANAVIPEMHRQVVETAHWMSGEEFAQLFALAQSAPGPNLLIVTLVGWRVAGLAGALTATVAMCAPSSVLTYVAFGVWGRLANKPWRAPVQNGLAAVTVGLVAASGFLLAHAADSSGGTIAVTLGTAAFAVTTRLNPLWAFAAAALLGAAGFH